MIEANLYLFLMDKEENFEVNESQAFKSFQQKKIKSGSAS
jgi:hypothetical protein